jgi:hypothetical protein
MESHDVLLRVLEGVDEHRDVCACACVCRRWYDVLLGNAQSPPKCERWTREAARRLTGAASTEAMHALYVELRRGDSLFAALFPRYAVYCMLVCAHSGSFYHTGGNYLDRRTPMQERYLASRATRTFLLNPSPNIGRTTALLVRAVAAVMAVLRSSVFTPLTRVSFAVLVLHDRSIAANTDRILDCIHGSDSFAGVAVRSAAGGKHYLTRDAREVVLHSCSAHHFWTEQLEPVYDVILWDDYDRRYELNALVHLPQRMHLQTHVHVTGKYRPPPIPNMAVFT